MCLICPSEKHEINHKSSLLFESSADIWSKLSQISSFLVSSSALNRTPSLTAQVLPIKPVEHQILCRGSLVCQHPQRMALWTENSKDVVYKRMKWLRLWFRSCSFWNPGSSHLHDVQAPGCLRMCGESKQEKNPNKSPISPWEKRPKKVYWCILCHLCLQHGYVTLNWRFHCPYEFYLASTSPLFQPTESLLYVHPSSKISALYVMSCKISQGALLSLPRSLKKVLSRTKPLGPPFRPS